MSVPKTYWGEAVLTATFLINRISSQVLDFKSHVDVLSKFFPSFNGIGTLPPKIFECVSFIHIPKQSRDKLDPRALRCVFLGYSSNQKGYKYYHPPTKRSYNTMDVTFLESQPHFIHTYLQGEIGGMEDKLSGIFPRNGEIGGGVLPQPVNVPNVSTSNTSSSPTVQDISAPRIFRFCTNTPCCSKCSSLGFI